MERYFGLVLQEFSNRELAIIVWGLILFIWAVQREPIRKSLKALVKAASHPKNLLTLCLMTIYVCLIIFLLHSLGLWNPTNHLKETIVWAIIVALSMVINVTSSMKDERFFRKTVLSTISLTIVLEFFINLFPFSFFVELILVPVSFLVSVSLVIIETDQRLASLKRPLNWFLAFVGLLFTWHATRSLLSNLNVLNADLLIDLALPSILTLMFLPFIYVLAMALSYSSLFFRLDFQNRGSPLRGYAKLKALSHFGVNLSKLNKWSKAHFILKFDSKDEIINLFG